MQKNTSKKVRPLLVGVMVFMIALVLGMGGFTLAKYISTTETQSNQATVAKWGFVVTANASELFGTEYKGTGLAVTGSSATGTVVVKADTANERNLVAPGTTGSMTFTVSGTAEVMSKLTITATNTNNVVLTKTEDSSTYTPVKWTLKKGEAVVDGCENVQIAKIVDTINALDDQDQEVAPNTQLNCAGTYTLSWSWAFSDGNDAQDTILGQIASGSTVTGYTATTSIDFGITISIEQIQKA